MIAARVVGNDDIVELKKKCSCADSVHEGPHWLHEHRVLFRSEKRMMKLGGYIAEVARRSARGRRRNFDILLNKHGIIGFATDEIPLEEIHGRGLRSKAQLPFAQLANETPGTRQE